MSLTAYATVQDEERLFTQLIDKYKGSDAPWSADVVGRAIGNRGNARSRQGMFDEAILDYNEAMRLCPWSVDPLLNRCSLLLSNTSIVLGRGTHTCDAHHQNACGMRQLTSDMHLWRQLDPRARLPCRGVVLVKADVVCLL